MCEYKWIFENMNISFISQRDSICCAEKHRSLLLMSCVTLEDPLSVSDPFCPSLKFELLHSLTTSWQCCKAQINMKHNCLLPICGQHIRQRAFLSLLCFTTLSNSLFPSEVNIGFRNISSWVRRFVWHSLARCPGGGIAFSEPHLLHLWNDHLTLTVIVGVMPDEKQAPIPCSWLRWWLKENLSVSYPKTNYRHFFSFIPVFFFVVVFFKQKPRKSSFWFIAITDLKGFKHISHFLS